MNQHCQSTEIPRSIQTFRGAGIWTLALGIFAFVTPPQLAESATNKSHSPLRVVIDPGHGGADAGASYSSIQESTIVLQIAKRLEEKLKRDKQFELLMTRTQDTGVPLQERVRMAENFQADVLLSLHTNASSDEKIHGVEFYFQNHLAPDEESLYFADRENQVSQAEANMSQIKNFVLGNRLLSGLSSSLTQDKWAEVSTIIEDLQKTQRIWKSHELSQSLIQSWNLDPRLRTKVLRQAPFQVISAGTGASVLVEIGFLSNPQEAQKLKSQSYQLEIADRLAAGLVDYAKARNTKKDEKARSTASN